VTQLFHRGGSAPANWLLSRAESNLAKTSWHWTDGQVGSTIAGTRHQPRHVIKSEESQVHQVKFYPVGNGDTSQIILNNGKRILFDYHRIGRAEDDDEPEIDLNSSLRQELKEVDRNYFDVVAFTHADADHIRNSTDFFELRHAKKYQGADRIKIKELWVPAAMILETSECGDRGEEFVIWRQEARHRLKEGEGIRVFSKPEKLKTWLSENGISLESRRHLITDAGQTASGFALTSDGVEFFCHSPFVKHVDDGDDLRNPASLIFNVRFRVGGNDFDYLAIGDSEWQVLEDIVNISEYHGNHDRLNWDLFNIPHHCSYLALSDEKGAQETVPKPNVEKLLLAGREGAYIVSSSKPIENTPSGRQQKMPPHVQAKVCYERYLKKVDGAKFLVTMEEPSKSKPEPIVFIIDDDGITRKKQIISAPAIITSSPAPRAG